MKTIYHLVFAICLCAVTALADPPTSTHLPATQNGNNTFTGINNFTGSTEINGTSIGSTYQPLNADLTTIAGLSTTGFAKRTGTHTWTLGTISLTTDVSGILPVANGGSGTSTPALIQGTNITITGSWPNQTINASGGGGGGTLYSVADSAARFGGSYHNGDLVKETGQTESITLTAVAEAGNYASGGVGTYFAIFTPDASEYDFWFDVNSADGSPAFGSGWVQVNIAASDSAATIAGDIAAAMAGNSAFSTYYTATNNGDGTVTVAGVSAFAATAPIPYGSPVGVVENTAGEYATNTTFLVIDSTQTGSEAGYSPQHPASDWQQHTLSSGAVGCGGFGGITSSALVILQSLGSGSNVGVLGYSAGSGIVNVFSSNPADTSTFNMLVVHY